MRTRTIILFATVAALLLFKGCIEYNEEPPPFQEFKEGTIVTIAQVKQLYAAELAKPWTERVPVQITEDLTVRGFATATDKKNGNL